MTDLTAILSAAVLALTMAGANAQTAKPKPTVAPPLRKPGWVLTFHDEFNGKALDTKKWWDCYWHGRTHGDQELEYYAPDSYEVKSGMLRLRADRREMGGKPYTSGMIESHDKFSQKYGWFEIRTRVPRGKGYWPAFWLLPATKKWPPEIDVLEILDHEPNKVYMTNHWIDDAGKHEANGGSWVGPDFSDDFHVYAVEWKPGEIIWYVDGVERFRSSKGVPDEPMYIVANLAVGGDWPGYPDATTPFPAYMDIDYIRVYKQVDR